MITLQCYPGYEDTYTVAEHLVCGFGLCCPPPLEFLPALVADDLLRNPASEEVLRQLGEGAWQLDADPCYLSYRGIYRQPLLCFEKGWQAALAVAAVAEISRDAERLRNLLRNLPDWPLVSCTPGNIWLELTPELCDARIWRALNSLDLPVNLAADLKTLERLRGKLACTPPKEGRERPYRLVQCEARRRREVLTCQDTTGWDSDPRVVRQDSPDGGGETLLTGGDGFDLVTSRWQDPASWYNWDLIPALYKLPVPRIDPHPPVLSTKYTIRDRITCQSCLDNLQKGQTLQLMILDRDAAGNWRTDERLLENCSDYGGLFEEALRNADTPRRWVLAADLDRPPICLQELTECRLLFGFLLYKDTVTLTTGTEALYCFLKALERYGDTGHAPQEEDPQPKEEPSHV